MSDTIRWLPGGGDIAWLAFELGAVGSNELLGPPNGRCGVRKVIAGWRRQDKQCRVRSKVYQTIYALYRSKHRNSLLRKTFRDLATSSDVQSSTSTFRFCLSFSYISSGMFSSPTPRTAPRKSVYRPSGSVLRNGNGPGTPSAISERGREWDAQTPTRAARLKALRDASPARSIGGESVRTVGGGAAMPRYEVAEPHERHMLGKDYRMGLLSLGGLPREVNEALRRSSKWNVVEDYHM